MRSLATDLSDGVKLVQLMEIMGDTTLGRFYMNPRMRVQKAENVNLALEFIKSRGVVLTNVGAEDIVDGNLKLILGMIWTLILRFTIADIRYVSVRSRRLELSWTLAMSLARVEFADVVLHPLDRPGLISNTILMQRGGRHCQRGSAAMVSEENSAVSRSRGDQLYYILQGRTRVVCLDSPPSSGSSQLRRIAKERPSRLHANRLPDRRTPPRHPTAARRRGLVRSPKARRTQCHDVCRPVLPRFQLDGAS